MNRWIESTSKSIAVWTFNINKSNGSWTVSFGIISKEFEAELNQKPPSHLIPDVGSGRKDRFGEGDRVKIKLDLKKGIISSKINDRDWIMQYTNIEISKDIRYKMIVSLSKPNSSVTLKEFIHITNTTS